MNPDSTSPTDDDLPVQEPVPLAGGAAYSPDCLIVTDPSGLILDATPAASALLRCPKEFLLGKPLPLFADKNSRAQFYDVLARLRRDAAAEVFETLFARRGEDARVANVFVYPGEGSSGALYWMARDVTERRRHEAAQSDLRRRLTTAQEDERRRVARELHDSFGQLLTALSLSAHAVRTAAPLAPVVAARLDEVDRIIKELAQSAHDLAVRLRPTALDDIGLMFSLDQLVAEWSGRTGVRADYLFSAPDGERFPPEVETVVYRVVQEALTNVSRHARAERVSVVVGRLNDHATVAVEDDGVGFDLTATPPSDRLGILGMRERVTLVGGWLEIESQPGTGTTVLVRLPLSSP